MGGVEARGSLRFLVVSILAWALVSCQGAAPKAEDPQTWDGRSAKVFAVGKAGLEPLLPSVPGGGLPAPRPGPARVVAVAASPVDARRVGNNPNNAYIVVGIEGWGSVQFYAVDRSTRIKMEQKRQSSLDGLRIGGIWPWKEGMLLQAYADPFAPMNSPRGQAGLFSLDNSGLRSLSPEFLAEFSGGNSELFAFFPDPRQNSGWLAQVRQYSTSVAMSDFLELSSLDAPRASRIERSVFETALAPIPISLAPPALRAALAVLAAELPGSAIIRFADSRGAARWYSFGDDPAASRELHAWADEAGDILLLPASGRGTLCFARGVSQLSFLIAPPLPGAWFTGCAFVPLANLRDLLLVATWEAGGGDEGLSGIVVETLARP